jgi:hypothetical protein
MFQTELVHLRTEPSYVSNRTGSPLMRTELCFKPNWFTSDANQVMFQTELIHLRPKLICVLNRNGRKKTTLLYEIRKVVKYKNREKTAIMRARM